MWFPFFCGRGEDNTVDDDGFPIMGKTLYPFSITPEDEKLLPELKELFTKNLTFLAKAGNRKLQKLFLYMKYD